MNHRQSRIVISVLLLLGLLASLPFWTNYAQSDKVNQQKPAVQIQRRPANQAQNIESAADQAGSGGFIIVRSEHGAECRPLTAADEQAFPLAERSVSLQAIGAERTEQLQLQQGIKITLRGTQQLENFPTAKQAFLRAAAKWEAIIQTPITIVIDVDFGTTFFGTPYPDPNIIGATSQVPLGLTGSGAYGAVRNTLLGLASSPQQTAVYNALPIFSLPTELGNASNVGATSSILRVLGALPPVANPDQELPQIGPPPAIGFNSALPFDFDPSNGIDSDKLDFEATAIHEIGHALGFISFMGTRELSLTATFLPTLWDFFRFRPGGLILSSLGSRLRAQVAGGEQNFFVGGEEYGLSTGTPNGTNGDEQQGSHWKDFELTGQYVGIMDPTAANGERNAITSADVVALNYFGYKINPNAQVFELLAVSDNTREESQTRTNALIVNRFSPPRFPAKLEAFRVLLPSPSDGSSPVGQTLRIVAFADPNRTGQPPANPSLLLDRTITIPTLPGNRILDVVIPDGPTINSGDLYVGMQSASASVLIAADLNGRQQNRSFISTNSGQSFQALTTVNLPTPTSVNFMGRAYLSMPFGNTPVPGALTISPSAVAPGGQAFTLFVFGNNFQQNSVVRVNNNDRQTTFQSGSALQAQIPAADVAAAGTAKVTVFTPGPGGGETVTVDLAITANNPSPALTRLDPPGGAAGAGNVTLNVFGTNFNSQSRIRVNGNERQTTLVNSTQLSTTLTQGDLASVAALSISVFNAAPGGGASNALTFSVVACNFSSSIGNQQTTSSTAPPGATVSNSGFVLSSSNGVCPWTATSSEPWVTFTGPISGVGRSVISYSIQPQPQSGTTPREARVTVGNQTLTIRQLGRASAISSASFITLFAPESITSVFGANIAKETRSADGTPLPTTLGGASVVVQDTRGASRLSPLFFVSPGQNNFQIPPGTATGNGFVIVAIDGQSYADSRVSITSVAPGLFAANANGQGVAAAVLLRVKADNSQSFENVIEFNQAMNKFVAKPIDFGPETDKLFLLLFGTGIRGRTSLNSVLLQVGGTSIPAQFAGPQGLVGLDQVNLELPRSLAGRGEVNITGTVNGTSINTVTVAFK